MKKWIKIMGCIFVLIVSSTIFSACDFFASTSTPPGMIEPPEIIETPSEIRVSGYVTEVEVGDDFIDRLRVEAKYEAGWQEVVKADYNYICNYTGSKYGTYPFKVYLKNFANVELTDTITVLPKTVMVPDGYTTKYTGNIVDIKSHYDNLSQGIYNVQEYVNMSNCGEYSINLVLNDTDKYVWVDADGNILRNPVQKINWSITKANAKIYSGISEVKAYKGDTLYDLMVDNNLQHITWQSDGANAVTNKTLVTGTGSYIVTFNEDPLNYLDGVTEIIITEYITTANYTVEYYLFDGENYVKEPTRTIISSGTIGDFVYADIMDIDGFIFNSSLSSTEGKIIKQDGLVLKLYYDLSE